MTDQPPIIVPAKPNEAQIAAGIRQAGAAAGIILAAFGATAMANKVGVVVTLAPQLAAIAVVVGPLVWGAVTWLGQMATRRQATHLASIAANPAVPDSVAQIRQA